MGGFNFVQPTATPPPPKSGVGAASGSVISSGIGTGLVALGVSSGIAAPIAAIVAIGLQLEQAHLLRAKQARAENSAVDAAVAGWDNAVKTLVTAYNNGQASAADMQTYLSSPQTGSQGKLWQWYWSEVGPVVQPGRNGCMSGNVPHPPGSFCQGSYGAGCCVAYDDLDNSSLYILRALNATETDGQPHTANVLVVVGSKYGGVTRPAYSVTLKKPTLSMQVTGTASSALSGATSAVNQAAGGLVGFIDSLTGQPVGTNVGGAPPTPTNTILVAVVAAVAAGLVLRYV